MAQLDDREFAKRRKGFRDVMKDEGLDGILVTGLSDVRYLCGFSGSSGICILLRDRGYFLTDFRYRDQSELEVKSLRTVVYKASADEAVADILGGYGSLRLGFDPSAITYAAVLALRRKLRNIAHIVPLKGSLAALRARKSRSELILIRKGINIAEKAFLVALDEEWYQVYGDTNKDGVVDGKDDYEEVLRAARGRYNDPRYNTEGRTIKVGLGVEF